MNFGGIAGIIISSRKVRAGYGSDPYFEDYPISIYNWPFGMYTINSMGLGMIKKCGKSEYFEVKMNPGQRTEQYFIIRRKKFLWMFFYSALYYSGSINGVVTTTIYKSVFNHFEWDVENRCEKSWNGGESWSRKEELVKRGIKLIKSFYP